MHSAICQFVTVRLRHWGAGSRGLIQGGLGISRLEGSRNYPQGEGRVLESTAQTGRGKYFFYPTLVTMPSVSIMG